MCIGNSHKINQHATDFEKRGHNGIRIGNGVAAQFQGQNKPKLWTKIKESFKIRLDVVTH